jgi:hypothetical protein
LANHKKTLLRTGEDKLRGLPESERTAVKVDKSRPRVVTDSSVPEPQGGATDFFLMNPGNEEVERLSLDVKTVPGRTTAPLHEERVILRRTIPGDDVDLPGSPNGLLNQVDML